MQTLRIYLAIGTTLRATLMATHSMATERITLLQQVKQMRLQTYKALSRRDQIIQLLQLNLISEIVSISVAPQQTPQISTRQ
jgi:hypothetical protein